MHKLLERQIKKLTKAYGGQLEMEQLIEVVSKTYEEIDHERRLRTRSIKLMSDELLDSNKRIRERNELFISAILQNIVDGVITISGDGMVLYMNDSAKRIFGVGEDQSIKFYSLFPEDQRDRVETFISEDLSESIRNIELKGLSNDGLEIPLELSVSPLELEDNVSKIVILRDISQRKEAERQLIDSKEKAEEATETKARFLSTMSHEIRTPLNAVIGTVNLMLTEHPREDQMEYLDILKFSSENLLALINDILDFSKIEEGKISLEETEINVGAILDTIHDTNKFFARRKGVDLKIQHDRKIREKLIGDPYRLTQILNNLVGNALKFTDYGSVILKTKCIRRKRAYSRINFEVIDTGIGIKPEEVGKIFESFSQASSETTRKYGGTGLGLAISKQLVELMGGDIQVDSNEGKGSRFSFQLVLESAGKEDGADDQDASFGGLNEFSGTRALVVEDNKVNRFVVSKFLNKWGVEVDHAIDGEEGVHKVSENDYDLILMDLQMPGIDGHQATERIRSLSDPEKASTPIIALTASAMIESRNKVFEAGMNGFIAKPFSPDDLRETMLNCLKKSSQ